MQKVHGLLFEFHRIEQATHGVAAARNTKAL